MKMYFTKILLALICVFGILSENGMAQQQEWLWAKTLCSDFVVTGKSVIDPASGDIYTIGIFKGEIDIDPGSGTYLLGIPGEAYPRRSVYILRTDASGEMIWAKSFQISEYYRIILVAGIDVDADGNVYVAGEFNGEINFGPEHEELKIASSSEDGNSFIVKMSSSGDFLWTGTFNSGSWNYVNDLKVDRKTGSVYLVGGYESYTDFDPGAGFAYLQYGTGWSAYVTKLDSSGNFLWAKQIIQNAENEIDLADKITIDPRSGDIYICGVFTGDRVFTHPQDTIAFQSTGHFDVFFVRYDETGNLLWARSMGGEKNDDCMAIQYDTTETEGSLHAAGSFSGEFSFNAKEIPDAVSSGFSDIFYTRILSTGQTSMGYTIGGEGDDHPTSMTISEKGDLFIAGTFTETVDFNPDPVATDLKTSNGLKDFFITKFAEGDHYAWTQKGGGTRHDEIRSIESDNQGNLIVTGEFFSPEIIFQNYIRDCRGFQTSFPNVFMARLNEQSIVDTDEPISPTWRIYPNPTLNTITIENSFLSSGNTVIEIFDMQGRKIVPITIENFEYMFETDLTAFPAGMYVVTLTNAHGTSQQVIVKQ